MEKEVYDIGANEQTPVYIPILAELKKYNPKKIIGWSLAGAAGLAAIIGTGCLIYKKYNKKNKN